jgi:hypothetical protein
MRKRHSIRSFEPGNEITSLCYTKMQKADGIGSVGKGLVFL